MNRKIHPDPERFLNLEENDVISAMRDFGSYLDITPEDFRVVYAKAYAIARRRFLGDITAADIMSNPVLTVPADMSLRDAVEFLDEHNISGAPVVNREGAMAGILSETDIARIAGGTRRPSPMHLLRAVMHREFDLGCLDEPVSHVMTKEVVSATPATPLSIMIDTMGKRNINRLPVLESGSLAGIVSRTDLLKTMGALQ